MGSLSQKRYDHNELIDQELDEDNKLIPFNDVINLIESFPKNDNKRMAILWLALTGARPSEIEGRSFSEVVFGKYWVWKPRKKQKGMRKESFPDWFWHELKEYSEKGSYSNNDIFGIKGESLARYINKHIRPKLGGEWLKKRPAFYEDGSFRMVYKYQLKNLRHNFQTLLFWHELHKFSSPDVALCRTSRRMKHSNKRITATHYLEAVDALNMNEYGHLNMGEIIEKGELYQDKLTRFF